MTNPGRGWWWAGLGSHHDWYRARSEALATQEAAVAPERPWVWLAGAAPIHGHGPRLPLSSRRQGFSNRLWSPAVEKNQWSPKNHQFCGLSLLGQPLPLQFPAQILPLHPARWLHRG